jgi:hypothetical protein
MTGHYAADDIARARSIAPHSYIHNCAISCIHRIAGFHIEKEVHVQGGPGTLIAEILEWVGPVLIMHQYANLTEVTTLTNATDVYADIWDGTVATKLTNGNPGGAVLSGCVVGSLFTKDEDYTQPYTVLNADQARFKEPPAKDVGFPFYVNSKAGATNRFRFHLTTTDSPVDFKMLVHFEYRPMNGATLEFL